MTRDPKLSLYRTAWRPRWGKGITRKAKRLAGPVTVRRLEDGPMGDQLIRPHLTHVERKPESSKATPWEASCLCGWFELTRLKHQAITAAELHWLAHPVVTR